MGCGVHNLGNGTVYLKSVPVKHHAKVIKLIVSGKHSRLPNLTFLALTVTDSGVYSVLIALYLSCERHTASGRNTETERAGGHIHAGHPLHIGMSLESGMSLTQGLELLLREEAALSEGGIKRRSGMSL